MSALPRLHKPEDIAAALGCSAWWVRERARRREIPFVMVSKQYRFTDQHLTEIIAIFEQRPDQPQGSVSSAGRRRSQPRRQSTSDTVVPLRARQPRRRPKAG